MLGPSCKTHFSLKQFRLLHERPTTFIVSQWQHDKSTPNFKYCLYRVSVFIIIFVSWVFSYEKEPPAGRPRWPIYLTNWGFTLCMLQSLVSSIMLVVSLIVERFTSKSLWNEKVLKMYSVYWALNIIATPVAFTITIIYWTLLYRAEGAPFTAINFIVHGLNSILMLLDLCLVSHPVQILHFIYPLLFALGYTIFSVIFYVAGGTTKTGSRYIYNILKWDLPGLTTGVCAGVMVLMIFLHMFTFFVYKCRVKVYEVLSRTKPTLSEKEHTEGQNGYVNNAMASEYV